eukprot:4952389-Pleurochrysis_carterae.AAC.3
MTRRSEPSGVWHSRAEHERSSPASSRVVFVLAEPQTVMSTPASASCVFNPSSLTSADVLGSDSSTLTSCVGESSQALLTVVIIGGGAAAAAVRRGGTLGVVVGRGPPQRAGCLQQRVRRPRPHRRGDRGVELPQQPLLLPRHAARPEYQRVSPVPS